LPDDALVIQAVCLMFYTGSNESGAAAERRAGKFQG